MKTITYDDSLYCLVPIEPSENMIDAPRGSLNGLELGINNCSQMMRHIDAYGMTTTGLPGLLKMVDTLQNQERQSLFTKPCLPPARRMSRHHQCKR